MSRMKPRAKDDDGEGDENKKEKNKSGGITTTSTHEGVRCRDAWKLHHLNTAARRG